MIWREFNGVRLFLETSVQQVCSSKEVRLLLYL